MKCLSVLLAFGLSAIAVNANAQQPAKQAKNVKEEMPYKAMFTRFEIGSPMYSQIVLNAWKDWDENRVNNFAPFFADTVTAIFPDGSMLKGKDNVMNFVNEYRNSLASVKSEVIAYTTLKNLENMSEPEVVLIWGNETSTKKDGTTQTISLHEVWSFNKDQKVAYFRQFLGQVPK